jgi:hypothetical protein
MPLPLRLGLSLAPRFPLSLLRYCLGFGRVGHAWPCSQTSQDTPGREGYYSAAGLTGVNQCSRQIIKASVIQSLLLLIGPFAVPRRCH